MLWVNGELRDEENLTIASSDRGLLLGDGLFETIRVVRHQPVFLTEHLCRLQVAAAEYRLPIDRPGLRAGVAALLGQIQPIEFGSLRITVTRGGGARGLSPILLADQEPLAMITAGHAEPRSPSQRPDRILPGPHCRSSAAISSRMKTLSYTDNLSAMAWARQQGADDVLFFNEREEATCTTMANIFVETNDGFLTPPLSAGILPGIARAQILRMASKKNINVDVRHLGQNDIWGRTIYRTNSLLGVVPGWFDYGAAADRAFPLVTDTLLRLYQDAEREDIAS